MAQPVPGALTSTYYIIRTEAEAVAEAEVRLTHDRDRVIDEVEVMGLRWA